MYKSKIDLYILLFHQYQPSFDQSILKFFSSVFKRIESIKIHSANRAGDANLQ